MKIRVSLLLISALGSPLASLAGTSVVVDPLDYMAAQASATASEVVETFCHYAVQDDWPSLETWTDHKNAGKCDPREVQRWRGRRGCGPFSRESCEHRIAYQERVLIREVAVALVDETGRTAAQFGPVHESEVQSYQSRLYPNQHESVARRLNDLIDHAYRVTFEADGTCSRTLAIVSVDAFENVLSCTEKKTAVDCRKGAPKRFVSPREERPISCQGACYRWDAHAGKTINEGLSASAPDHATALANLERDCAGGTFPGRLTPSVCE